MACAIIEVDIDFDHISETISFAKVYYKDDVGDPKAENIIFQCLVDPPNDVAYCYNMEVQEGSVLFNYKDAIMKIISDQLYKHYIG